MTLIDQQISVNFSKGLNTKTDSKQIMPGEMLSLKNATFISPNEISEAPGYTALPKTIFNSSSTITAGNSLGKFSDLITLNDGQTHYAFSESVQKFLNKGTKLATSVSAQTVNTGVAQIFSSKPESVIAGVNVLKMANGFECYYYQYNVNLDGNNAIPTALVIFDPSIGEVVYFNVSSNYSQNAVAFGNIITFINNTNYMTIDVTSPTTTTTGSIGPFTAIYAVSQTSSNYYVLGLVSGNLVLNEYTSASALVSSATVLASATVNTGTIINDTFNSRLIVSWTDGTVAHYAIYSYTLAVVLASTAITFTTAPGAINAITGGTYNSTSLALYFQVSIVSNAIGTPVTITNQSVIQFNLVSGTLTQGQSWFNVSLASNALPDGLGNQYIAFGHFTTALSLNTSITSTDQPNYFMMRISPTTYTIIGKYAEDQAANYPLTNLSNLIQLSSTEFLFPYPQSNGEGIIYPTVGTGVANAQINVFNAVRGLLDIGTKLNSLYLGNNENITGGATNIYDNVGIAESGFNLFPEFVQGLASTASGAVFLAPETYTYQAMYQWFDAQGNKHRSSPSDPFIVKNTATHGSNIIVVAGLSMSEIYKVSNVQVLLYRNAPSININTYFLVAVEPNNPQGLVTYADIIPDADIVGAEQLYTTGGEVPNYAPPSFSSMTAYKNRIIGVQADNPYVFWYSKQQIEFFPIEFSDLFTQVIDGSKGPINSINMIDDKLVLFCENGIFYILGDGPSPNGTNNDFTYPQIITADTSCNNTNSMVILPIGIMFSSAKGIHLLDRGLQVSYIGAPVEGFNTQNIVSATLLPNTTQVRFALAGGSCLIYDYLVQQWSELSEITAVDSTVYQGKYTYLQADGTILEEANGNFSNNGTPVAMSFQTGWFSFANLQGFQRIKQLLLLLTAQNNTSLRVDFAYNYDPTVQDTRTIPVTASSTPIQYRVFPVTQKAESMQITITEVPTSTTTGGGLTMSGLMFTFGAKKGAYKVTAAQSFG